MPLGSEGEWSLSSDKSHTLAKMRIIRPDNQNQTHLQSTNKLGLEGQSAWVGLLALLRVGCVTLGKLLHLSVPLLPQLRNGNGSDIHLLHSYCKISRYMESN